VVGVVVQADEVVSPIAPRPTSLSFSVILLWRAAVTTRCVPFRVP
jgi:hypothetical protein